MIAKDSSIFIMYKKTFIVCKQQQKIKIRIASFVFRKQKWLYMHDRITCSKMDETG